MLITAYHGDNFGTVMLEPVCMLLPNANCAEGPGIYFSNKLRTAKSYGKNIIRAELDMSRFVESRAYADEVFSVSQIASIIYKMAQLIQQHAVVEDDEYNPMETFISNWKEWYPGQKVTLAVARELARYIIIDEVRNLLLTLADIDIETFVYCWNMEMSDIDGVYAYPNKAACPDEIHFAVLTLDIQVDKL